jgi:hypothetical protein
MGAHLPIDGSMGVPAVARAYCPWVRVKPSDLGKMPLPLAPPSIGSCALGLVLQGIPSSVTFGRLFVGEPPFR